MARGFDDIHRVFTVQRSKSSRQQSSDRSRETSSSRDSLPKIAASNNVCSSNTSSGGNLANQNSKKHSSGSSGEESPSIKVKSSFSPVKAPTGFSFKSLIKKVGILRCKIDLNYIIVDLMFKKKYFSGHILLIYMLIFILLSHFILINSLNIDIYI